LHRLLKQESLTRGFGHGSRFRVHGSEVEGRTDSGL
jgi:hypothetical protein